MSDQEPVHSFKPGDRVGYSDYVSLGEYRGTVVKAAPDTKYLTVQWDARPYTESVKAVEFATNLRRLEPEALSRFRRLSQ